MITGEERTLQILTVIVACGLAFLIGWLTFPTPPKIVQIMTTEYVESAPVTIPAVPLGATTQTPPGIIAFFETTLASNISSSATSFTLTSATDKEGTTLASSTYAFIIDEGSANEEIVIADCTSTACTNASRGVSVKTGTTTVATLQKSHRRGASVKITDAPYLPQLIKMVNGVQTIPAIMRYTATAACSGSSNNSDICDKAYIDGVAVAGASNANETTKGIVELATQIEMASSTNLGGTSASLVLQSRYATSSPYGSGLWSVVTQNDGKISPLFIATSSSYVYNWGALHTFTGGITSSGTFTQSGISTFSATTTFATSTRVIDSDTTVTVVAGDTFTGYQTPQPAYIATSTGTLIRSDANAYGATDFDGFVVSSGSSGQQVYLQRDGIVTGFTGLTAGSKYYVQDAVGTIGTSVGTAELFVGQAINATQILLTSNIEGTMQYLGSVSFTQNFQDVNDCTAFATSTYPMAQTAIIDANADGSGSSAYGHAIQVILTRTGNTTQSDFDETTHSGPNIDTKTVTVDWTVATDVFKITGSTALNNSTSLTCSGTVYLYR